ncbi:MAG: acetate--CoA ligase family protein [Oscillospiraceae bacterium]|nr:acetate--CoA ligase family protein [Oscillospiraceae bacterium]
MKDITTFFKPKSVAVIGASNKAGKVGNSVMKNLINGKYEGEIYPINPNEETIEGIKVYRSISEVPNSVDLGIITIPVNAVIQCAQECGQKGVKSLIVITAGFKEIGEEGALLENQLAEICKEYNMNLLGPNCLGAIDTHTKLNASFAQMLPHKGDIAFISQSGAMFVAILDWSITLGIGFSSVMSIGNKAQLSEIELIEYLGEDPDTNVIVCYLETITNGSEFLRVAKKVTKKKPIIILKAGTSEAGAKAASSHTGSLVGSDFAYDVAFKQAGVIRAKSMQELFNLGRAFSRLPLPKGDRVTVVTNAGGGGVITSDSIEKNNLKMATLNEETTRELKENLPIESNISNPIDVLGDASPERYQFALSKASADSNTDSIIVITCPTGATKINEITKEIIDIKNSYPDKPMFVVHMGGVSFNESIEMLGKEGMPVYTFPETCTQILKEMIKYVEYKDTINNETLVNITDVNYNGAKEIFENVKSENRTVLLGSEAAKIAEYYGISAAPTILTRNADEAANVAEKIGYPVVLKIASDKILHKTDVGGVKVGLNSYEEVKSGFMEILENVKRTCPDIEANTIEIQKMMPKGIETIIGMVRDVQFGPIIAFGMGGIYVNLIKDASFRVAEGLTHEAIQEQLSETKAYTLLKGYRGEEGSDITAVKNVIARVAKLTLDFPEISELDINPIFVYKNGISALDIKITLK